LPRRRVSKNKCDVILSPESVGAFTAYLLAPMIVGTSVQQGASCFTDRLNKRIAVDSFSLIDDGRAQDGVGTALLDDEGTPTKSTTIVEDGLLKCFLYDTLTACWSEQSSTGNAKRASDTLGRTYLKPPEPLPTNLTVKSGDYDSEELIEETKEGILLNSIDYTFPLIPERGYSSFGSSYPALVIENGKVEGYIQNITISGELNDILTKICGIGKKTEQSAFIGSIITSSPHVRIGDMALSYD
jgi:PmbA protein